MRSSIVVSAAVLAVASAQSSVDSYPQTAYLSLTNSLGVVTGQPAAATAIPSQPAADTAIPAQPAAVTSQPLPADIPAVGPGLHTLILPGTGSAFNSTRTVTVSANNSTTMVVVPSTSAADASATASGSGASRSTGASRSATRSGSGASASPTTGAGAHSFNVAAGGILGFGAFMAAFL